MHIPQTAAKVPYPRYKDASVRYWLNTPQVVEKSFAMILGETIPDNYLEIFSDDLNKLHKAIIITSDAKRFKDSNRIFYYRGMLFKLKLFVDLLDSTLILKEIIIRPCAEGNKFFNIILYHLIRCCKLYSLDFLVETPLNATTAILKKYFGEKIITSVKTIRQSYLPDDKSEYMELSKDTIKDLVNPADDLGIVLGLTVKPNPKLLEFNVPEYENTYGPQIICNPSQFPLASTMNV